MKKYDVKIKKLNPKIEEAVTLILEDNEITCFATFCPYEIEEGHTYLVSFDLFIIDDYNYIVEEINEERFALQRIGDGFGYWIIGQLKSGVLYSVIPFYDEVLLDEFHLLDNKFIKMRVDRIDVSFE